MDNKNARARARLCRKGDMWYAACPTRAHAPAMRNPQLSSYREQKEVRGRWADIFGFTGTAAATWLV